MINVTDSEEIPALDVIRLIAATLNANSDKVATRLAVLLANEVRYGRARQLGVLLEAGGIESEPFYEKEAAVEWLRGGDV
ncbi:MAG: hypothetical protein JSW51_03655 [Gemmatimonadota bacterium]|nr:MAG: hypothetical protein JSW51_03655 [Gemmatimonadota bacterium]